MRHADFKDASARAAKPFRISRIQRQRRVQRRINPPRHSRCGARQVHGKQATKLTQPQMTGESHGRGRQ